jgi:hypothetical protein
MRHYRRNLSGLAALLAVLSALLAGCAPEGPGHLIVYAPAGSIIAAVPPARLLVKLPDGTMRPSGFLQIGEPLKLTIEPAGKLPVADTP